MSENLRSAALDRPMVGLRRDIRQLLNEAFEHHQARRFEEAEATYLQALEIEPEHPEALHKLGMLMYEKGDLLGSLSLIQRSMEGGWATYSTHANLGRVFESLGAIEQAEQQYLTSLRLNPKAPISKNNLGSLRMKQGRFDEAIVLFNQAARIDPTYRDPVFNRGHAYLMKGDFARGWRDREFRFGRRGEYIRAPILMHPIWKGEPIIGKRLLVRKEQGIGDEMWAAGMYADIPCARITVEATQKLRPLLRRSFPRIQFADEFEIWKEPGDVEIPAASLPRYVRRSWADFPIRERYLFPDRLRRAYWQRRINDFGEMKFTVGICWRSSNTRGERALDCTELQQWGDILRVPGVRFVNLQPDECDGEIDEFAKNVQQLPVDLWNDIDETAALISALDLVISAPTSTSILAAAIGVPTWQLNSVPEWQLHGKTDGSHPWYPTMRVYMKQLTETWSPTLKRIALDLQRFAHG